MSHELVKITQDEDGFTVDKNEQVWCLGVVGGGSPMCFCSGQVYGVGEGAALFKVKFVVRGGITCPGCLSSIKEIKSIKL